MAESKSNDKTTNSLSVKEVRAPNLAERAKEKFEAMFHPQNSSCHHNRETHELHNGIDKNISLDDVRAPNVFERAKEEFQALGQVFHHKKEAPIHDIRDGSQMAESNHKQEIPISPSETKGKEVNIFVKAKEEIKAALHHEKPKHHHHNETHGRSDDIDENTATNEVKGPNVYERVKEEFEAVFQAIHPKKEAKEEIEATIHHEKSQHHHHKETHGRSDDIGENTPANEVKGPNVYERVKEEFEAVFQAIHPKKES
ncbi:uncharacterized protein LOC133302592 [Gastrolobium bilobum]|uniref:uncharacterized protein LOC133302592 n=1 Tax=Gastrolobium bilobum TaxID=150636 RepID=UPI002AAF8D4C|nr:uncharacterized protein LOC133302592 [Gastrolobium bilobum]